MLNSTFRTKPLSTWCIHQSHAFKMEPLYGAVRAITCNHIANLWAAAQTPWVIPSSGYLIAGFLLGWPLLFRSCCLTRTSLSSLPHSIKMSHPHFHVFRSQEKLLCKTFYLFGTQVPVLSLWAFSKLFLITVLGGQVWAAGKSLLSVVKTSSRRIRYPVQNPLQFLHSLDPQGRFGLALVKAGTEDWVCQRTILTHLWVFLSGKWNDCSLLHNKLGVQRHIHQVGFSPCAARVGSELRYQSFSTTVKSPSLPEVGTHWRCKRHLIYHPKGTDLWSKVRICPHHPPICPWSGDNLDSLKRKLDIKLDSLKRKLDSLKRKLDSMQ